MRKESLVTQTQEKLEETEQRRGRLPHTRDTIICSDFTVQIPVSIPYILAEFGGRDVSGSSLPTARLTWHWGMLNPTTYVWHTPV